MYLIKNIKGVGAKTLKSFNMYNINTTNDLLNYFPIKYNLFNKSNELTKLDDNEDVTIYAKIISNINVSKYTKTKFSKFKVLHNNKKINIVAFNQIYLNNQFKENDDVYINGKYNYNKNEIILSKIFNEEKFDHIKPIYNMCNVYDTNVSKIINEIITNNKFNDLEILPKYIIDKYNLINYNSFINKLHFPKTKDDIKEAFKRIKVTEAYQFQKDMIERINVKEQKEPIIVNNDDLSNFINDLPFNLTNDQTKAINELIEDFSSNLTQSRLIQGDVGSGKTVVSLVAAYIAMKNNYQVAFMAPTEILANQHYNYFNRYLKKYFNGKILTSSTKNKKIIKDDLLNGNINFIVGTHSLTYEDVLFNKLGLVIIDEQHKFGVKDRNKLIKKGLGNLIYLTATPIPRTLAITMFQDSNISLIKEKPKGRENIITKSVEIDEIDSIINQIKEVIKREEKVFIVAPAITSNHAKYNVLNVFKAIKNRISNYNNIYMLHGSLDNKKQDEVINSFISDKNAILVSTSMVEVGIDISNASLIAIFGANYFGLSQLHQLRGRVGRSSIKSYCYLISENKNDERLKIIENTLDGFLISEKDLELRGTGTFLSYKQSGLNDFKYLNFIKDYKLLENIKNDILNNK